MFQLKIEFADMTSGNWDSGLVDKHLVKKRQRDPQLTENCNQKKYNHLERRLLKVMTSNVSTKLLLKAFMRTANTRFEFLNLQ